MSVTVVSAVYGDYDPVVPVPAQSVHARYVLVTDQPRQVDGWEVVVEPRPELGNRMAAKIPKCCPWLYADYDDVLVWVDAACRFKHADSLRDLLLHADGKEISQFDHPYRNCIYTELEASLPVWKYKDQNIQAQVAHYRKHEHPPDWGLWATGVIVYDGIDPDFGESWLLEQMRWSDQDQLSEPALLRRFDLRPNVLPGNIFSNPMIGWDYGHRVW